MLDRERDLCSWESRTREVEIRGESTRLSDRESLGMKKEKKKERAGNEGERGRAAKALER